MIHPFVDHISRALTVLPFCEIADTSAIKAIEKLLRGALSSIREVPAERTCVAMFRNECREVLVCEIHAAMECDDNGIVTCGLLRLALARVERALGLLPNEHEAECPRPTEEWDEHHLERTG